VPEAVNDPKVNEPGARTPAFDTTRWSLVLRAGRDDGISQAALAELCRAYWLPLYIYVRRRGHSAHDAEDLTQGFFADLLVRGAVSRADRERGRFRTFLLAALTNYLRNAHDHAQAARRGGNVEKLSIDTGEAAALLEQLGDGGLTPDQAFDRSWAIALLDRARQKLRAEQERLGKGRWFERLWPHLQARADSGVQEVLAAEFGLTRNAVAVATHRLASRYRELVQAEIAETVGSLEEWRAEQRELLGSLET
jgi:RNA polymerase sigma-70 factor (ECF subfamily)